MDRIAPFLASRCTIETSINHQVESKLALILSGSEFSNELERRVANCHNEGSEQLCQMMQSEAESINYDPSKVPACPSFTLFLRLCAEQRSLPAKIVNDSDLLRKYIGGQCQRFSRETISKKLIRVYTEERKLELTRALSETKFQQINDLIHQHLDILSMSDHMPIRCRVVCSLKEEGEEEGAGEEEEGKGKGEGEQETTSPSSTPPVTRVVSSWNVQEFVRDGVMTYIGSMPSISGTKGSGKSTMVMDAMLCDAVRAHHCRRVVDVVRREIDQGEAVAVCLQEVDEEVMLALRQWEEESRIKDHKEGETTTRQIQIHACKPADKKRSKNQCQSTTCVVVSTRKVKNIEPLEDIVVVTKGKGTTTYVRRYARVMLRPLDGCGDAWELCSVHVRHDAGIPAVRGVTEGLKEEGGKKSGGEGFGEESGKKKKKQKEKKRNGDKDGEKGKVKETTHSSLNAKNMYDAEKELLVAAGTSSTNMIVAVGDWNGPHTKCLEEISDRKGSTWWCARLSPPNTSTQYLNPHPVDGIVVMTSLRSEKCIALACSLHEQ